MISLFRQGLHFITSWLLFSALLCGANFAHVLESSTSNGAIDDFTSMLAVRSATLSYGEASITDELHTLLSNNVQDLMGGPVKPYNSDLKHGLEGLRQDMRQELTAIRQETAAEFTKVREENKIETGKMDSRFSAMQAPLAVTKQSLGVTKISGNTTSMKNTADGPESLVRTMGRRFTSLLYVSEPSYVGIGIVFILVSSLCCMTLGPRLLMLQDKQNLNDDNDDLHEVWVKKPSAESQQRAQLIALFAKLDALNDSDDSPEGYITYADLETALAMPEFAAEFERYGISHKDASVMFDSLDDTGDGLVSYRDFVNGVMNESQWYRPTV